MTAGFMRAIARLEQAYESDDDGRFLALAEEFVRRYPQVPDGHATLGEALQRNGRYAQAVASVEQAMSKGFDATHGHLILAAIHDDAGDTAKSLREYTLVAGSDDAEVRQFCLLNRARLLLRIDDVEQAVKDANAAIAILPDESAYAVRGHVHRRRGDLEAALRDYERAIQLSPGNPDLQDNRAQVLELLGRTEQTHAKQTVAKEPKDVAAIPQRQPQPAPRPTPQPAPQPAPPRRRASRRLMLGLAAAGLAVTVAVVGYLTYDDLFPPPAVRVGVHPYGVVVSPDGRRVYVANEGSNTVSVIDTAGHTITADIRIRINPRTVAVTPDGRRVYVVSHDKPSIAVIDTARNTVVKTIDGPDDEAVISRDGRRLYVIDYGDMRKQSGRLAVIDTARNAVLRTIPVAQGASGVAVTPDGRHVYVSHYLTGAVSVIDTTRNAVAQTIPTGAGPGAVAISPDGRRAYLGRQSGDVSVIDTGRRAVISTIPTGATVSAVAVAPDGRHAYVADSDDGRVSVIDTARNAVTGTIRAGQSPVGLAVSPDGRRVYATGWDKGTLTVIDTTTNKVVGP